MYIPGICMYMPDICVYIPGILCKYIPSCVHMYTLGFGARIEIEKNRAWKFGSGKSGPAACSSYGAEVAKDMRWVGGVAARFCIIQGKQKQPQHSGVTAVHASEAGQTCCPALQDPHTYAHNGYQPCWGPVWSRPHGMVEQETSHFFFLRWGWVIFDFCTHSRRPWQISKDLISSPNFSCGCLFAERALWCRESKRRVLWNYFPLQIYYEFLISKCRGDRDLGLCTFGFLRL